MIIFIIFSGYKKQKKWKFDFEKCENKNWSILIKFLAIQKKEKDFPIVFFNGGFSLKKYDKKIFQVFKR